MTLEERDKETREIFADLDKKAAERKAKIERYARFGLDYEKIEQEEAKQQAQMAKIEELLDQYALSVWKAAWLMMEEGYENNEAGIDAFCAAHGEYQKIVR